ncbi:glutathione hydrolase 7-like [Thunnus albacares]|uniref:glutathione hydrolase 7-like n=1 Tax=Thunnus albacares TaxID=8236 RepID=UPI001CF6317F|nr:glutathione hydrolase 7-like [Thunnus albacares]
MEVSPETKLNKQSTFSYKSFGDSSQSADGSSPSDFTCDSNKKHVEDADLSHLPKQIPLTQLASGSPNLYERGLSNLKETNKDRSSQDTLILVYATSIIFATGATIALILQIYLGGSSVFIKGVLVSDHERCTALGQRVLNDLGSSVDAAIAATLCLGVVHPHVSGIGGGGVMLVHDIHKNETRLINFQGTAPKTLKEEMLQNGLELKAGLQVGVPGMLRGLHQAHRLYGSLSWKDVVTRAADVAKDGFNVSHSLAEAISKVKDEKLLQRFRTVFLPEGRALRPGSFLRMPSLARVLEAGLSNFYNGNLSQEMEDEVRANGGVLSREDISNYSVQVKKPVEGLFNEFIIQVPPPPSVGAALISVLNLLEGLNLSENNNTENQTYHQTAEALKASLAMASGLGDPKYNSSVNDLLFDILSKNHADVLRQRINHSSASLLEHYSSVPSLQTELVAGQVVVMGPDDLIVSVASSLNRPFGSRIITQSGVILNSLILDFSWPNKTRGQLQTNQRNRVQPGKRPLSPLMPTIVVPAWHKCGIYMALSGSDKHSLSAITQVLISALSDYKEKNNSLSLRRLHPQLQPNRLHAESEFPEESVQYLQAKGHVVQRVKTNTVVQGILRNKDIIKAIAVPQLFK